MIFKTQKKAFKPTVVTTSIKQLLLLCALHFHSLHSAIRINNICIKWSPVLCDHISLLM
jgi:hypothetical protein